MLKFHPITVFMKTYTNFKKKIFLIRVSWFKFIFLITFKVPILDLMLLPKNSVPFEGLNYSSGLSILLYGVVTVSLPDATSFDKNG